MYLTRMELNPARRGFKDLAGQPQRMHAAVEACIPRTASERSRKLWRLDLRGGAALLFVKTDLLPDFTHLAEQAGWPTSTTWLTREYEPFLAELRTGQVWAFRVTANPTHSGRAGQGQPTQRFGHVTVDQQSRWFLDRASGWGFMVAPSGPDAPDMVITDRVTKSFTRNGQRVTISTAVYEGHLVVTDPTALSAALTAGIGPAKAYGCGLITLSR